VLRHDFQTKLEGKVIFRNCIVDAFPAMCIQQTTPGSSNRMWMPEINEKYF